MDDTDRKGLAALTTLVLQLATIQADILTELRDHREVLVVALDTMLNEARRAQAEHAIEMQVERATLAAEREEVAAMKVALVTKNVTKTEATEKPVWNPGL